MVFRLPVAVDVPAADDEAPRRLPDQHLADIGLLFYNFKEFGNLSIVPIHRTDMTQATTTIDVQLNDNRITVPVYKAPSYTKDCC